VNKPEAQPKQKTTCGPDVTDWFVSQVNDAKKTTGAKVAKAALVTAQIAGYQIGIDARQVVEGGLAVVVKHAGKGHGKPTELSQKELDDADPGNNLAKSAFMAFSTNPIALWHLNTMAHALALAGGWWYSKVRTGGEWDFKNTTLKGRKTPGCQGNCDRKPTFTFCGMCQENEVPANIFYGHIGAYLGFSPLSLLLGSNYANLQKNGGDNWDPNEDINRISYGVRLPDPLTQSALCEVPQTQQGQPGHKCAQCTEKLA
jgi:hypothetical protein